ncbi:hypothetical protein ASZ90_001859 [hydrocarbon metagenome]|uniref:Uncharacterized protein n=1 Tax=hydrocarbon metagenome TaxID=938273 RepID=A0A0W8G533_9ZZZZ
MQAWGHTPSAWLDRPGAWQPSGFDERVQAVCLALGAEVKTASVAEGLGVSAGPASVRLAAHAVAASTGPLVTAGVAPLLLRPGPVDVAMDASVQTAGEARMILMAHCAVNRYDGWRAWNAGGSVPVVSVSRTSPPAVRIPARSSLGQPDETS